MGAGIVDVTRSRDRGMERLAGGTNICMATGTRLNICLATYAVADPAPADHGPAQPADVRATVERGVRTGAGGAILDSACRAVGDISAAQRIAIPLTAQADH